jgi:hypothetical protein
MDTADEAPVPGIDTSRPHSARTYDYMLGGKNHFAVDREAVDKNLANFPAIRTGPRENRAFLGRAVRYLVAEAGVRQFLDIGTGLPSHDNTHEIAQRAAPGARIVYVDNDPLVLAHARALLTSSPPGTTDYISGDLNNPAGILEIARQKLDFSRPVAIMLMGVLGHIGNPAENDDHFAWSIVRELTDALPSGGYLALHDTVDTDPAHNAALEYYNETGAVPYHARRPGQIARFFDGLEPVDPGIVPIHEWRPDPSPFPPVLVPSVGGVAQKP